MKVFGYLRVSGRGQIDGDGFDRQRAAIQKFCDTRGWIVSRWFEEPAVSGTTDHDERPAFVEMLSLMGGPATTDAFIVEKPDRLARDLIVSELLIAEVRKRGFTIWAAEGEVDLTNCNDPGRVFIRQIFGAMAQWEKSCIVHKLRAARDRKSAKLGRRVEGPIPYEVRDPAGAEIVRSVFEMRERGLTFRQIAAWLTQNKVLTPQGKTYWQRSTAHALYARYARRFRNVEPVRVNPEMAHEVGHVVPESAL